MLLKDQKKIYLTNQLKQKQSTAFHNKLIHVIYQLFHSVGFNKEFSPLSSETKSEQTEEKIQIPLWFRINKSEFDEVTSDISDNQNNRDFKITINNKTYDLKNAKNFWTKVSTSKISRNEVKKVQKELIQKDIDALEREKSNSIKKNNISKILENIDGIFTGTYLHYGEVHKGTTVERNIAENAKLKRRRVSEIEEKEKNINYKLFNEYFTNYRSPSNMYKKLREAEDEWNEERVFLIREVLNKTKKIIENVPENRKSMIEENEKIINIVERILYFNQLDQSSKV